MNFLFAAGEIAASDWFTGGGIAGGLLAFSAFFGPRVPSILAFLEKRRQDNHAFEERKKKVEFDAMDRVASALKDVAVSVAEDRATSITLASSLGDLAREVRLIGEVVRADSKR